MFRLLSAGVFGHKMLGKANYFPSSLCVDASMKGTRVLVLKARALKRQRKEICLSLLLGLNLLLFAPLGF